ncbi:MAG TPA: hypothetical protein VK806_04110 [Bacteroidia bacterium]|jgi:hypothetical protein|nr:hypothetical protein [Bacteroidia bacterium]
MCTRLELNARITEISGKLEEGIERKEILHHYTATWNVTERTVERYVALACDVLAGHMQQKEAIMEAIRAEAITEATEKWMRSSLELEAKLCAIADGEFEQEKLVRTKEGFVKVPCKPSLREMIYAIDKLWKMRGNYDPKIMDIPAKHRPVQIIVDSEKEKELVERILLQGKRKTENS